MNELLQMIQSGGKTIKEIAVLIEHGRRKISLFEPFPELRNISLFEHLKRFRKFGKWTLEDFLQAKAVDLDELDQDGHRMMYLFISSRDRESIKTLIKFGDKVSEDEYRLSKIQAETFPLERESQAIKDLFDYRPGRRELSIRKFVNKRHRDGDYLERVRYLLLDQAETSYDESSDEEYDRYDIPQAPVSEYDVEVAKKQVDLFNETGENREHFAVVEYRGFHRGVNCSQQEWRAIRGAAFQPEPIYSRAAVDPDFIVDDGNEADDEAEDLSNARKALVLKETWRETEQEEDDPSKYKTKRNFENLSLRMLQEYIMAFDRLVIRGEIQSFYRFPSALNPFLSTTCNAGKALLYGSGVRHSKIISIWRDPHYRRFTGKPKHPVMGYVDIYVLDLIYVRENSYCRDKLLEQGKISLNQMYMNGEGERIFVAEIPQQFHFHRFFTVFPDFSSTATAGFQSWKVKYHINFQRRTLQDIGTSLTTFGSRRIPEEKGKYIAALSKISEGMDKYVGPRIEEWVKHTLFAQQQKIVVCDDVVHGEVPHQVEHIRLK